MFIENRTDTISNEKIVLTFLRSLNVQAFPCGKRRSTTVDRAGTRIPFDPEARLNTEANNLKHSNINGFAQTYIESWDDTSKKLTVSLAGYVFSIDLDDVCASPQQFCSYLAEAAKSEPDASDVYTNDVYLNILIEETPLFLGEPRAYTTHVLGSLVTSNDESALDLPINGKTESRSAVEDYFFAGIALSPTPLSSAARRKYSASDGASFNTRDDFTYSISVDGASVVKKRIVSLHLLEKVDDTWKIHEPSKLPNIKHGVDENSVSVHILESDEIRTNTLSIEAANMSTANIGNLDAEALTISSKISVHNDNNTAEVATDLLKAESVVTNSVIIGEKFVPTLELIESDGEYQLQFTLSR